MFKINNITSDYHQEFVFSFDYGDVYLRLYYSDLLVGWFFGITYGDFVIDNRRLSNFPNLLNQYNNMIPFGLYCKTKNGLDVVSRYQFQDGSASLYFLNKEEVNDALNYDLRRGYE